MKECRNQPLRIGVKQTGRIEEPLIGRKLQNTSPAMPNEDLVRVRQNHAFRDTGCAQSEKNSASVVRFDMYVMNRNAGPHESFNFLCEIGPAPYAITRLEEDARSARTALQGRARRGAIPAWGPGCRCDWYMVVFHHAGRSLIGIR